MWRKNRFQQWFNIPGKDFSNDDFPMFDTKKFHSVDRQLCNRINAADVQQAESKRNGRHLYAGHKPPITVGLGTA
jgi:hypothetical protein